jgi:site-specific recombinase XerD
MPVPRECADLIRHFIRGSRNNLPNAASPFLFVGDHLDRGKEPYGFGKKLKRFIFDETGWKITPHLYRHVVHVTVLRRYPGAYAMVARILTHASINTTIKNYSYFDVSISLREYQRLVLKMTGGVPLDAASTNAAVAYGIDWERV